MRRAKLKIYSRWAIFAAVSPVCLLFAVFVLFPAAANLFFSFTDYKGLPGFPLKWLGFANYRQIFTNDFSDLWLTVKNTFIVAVSVSTIQNVLAVFLALLVNKKLKLKNFFRAAIFTPIILGPVVQGLVWTIMLDPFSGPVSQILGRFGVHSAFFGDPHLALALLIMVIIWVNIGFAMVLYLAGLQNIPPEYYEAGLIDGASGWSTFRHITLPLLRPTVTINVLLTIIGSLSMLDIILVTTNGGPGKATMTLSMFIFKNLVSNMGYAMVSQGYVAALSMFQFLLILVVVMIVQGFLRRKEVEL